MSNGTDPTRPAARVVVATVAAWLAVVLIGSSLVWAVISRAGDGVTGSSAPVLAGGDQIEPNPAKSSLVSPSPHQSRHDDMKHENSNSKPPNGQPSSSPKPSSSPTASPGTHSDDNSGKDHNGHSNPPAAPSTQLRTWSGRAGSVTVSCSGSLIHLISAQPNVGYRVEVETGTKEVQVVFERSSEGGETQITGTCSEGTPQLRSEVDD